MCSSYSVRTKLGYHLPKRPIGKAHYDEMVFCSIEMSSLKLHPPPENAYQLTNIKPASNNSICPPLRPRTLPRSPSIPPRHPISIPLLLENTRIKSTHHHLSRRLRPNTTNSNNTRNHGLVPENNYPPLQIPRLLPNHRGRRQSPPRAQRLQSRPA